MPEDSPDHSAPSATITEIIPHTGETWTRDRAQPLREWMSARYARTDEAYVRLNMITSLTGSAVGEDGTSDTLTGGADRAILGVVRAQADAVVVGAETVRAEGYVVPRHAQLAIVTASGELGGHRMSSGTDRVLLVCAEGRAEKVRERSQGIGRVVAVPARDGDLGAGDIVSALAAEGFRRLVCEGGPTLASAFIAEGVVDEVCVTVAPAIVAAARPFVSLSTTASTTVAGYLVDDSGFSYLRLRLQRNPAGAATE